MFVHTDTLTHALKWTKGCFQGEVLQNMCFSKFRHVDRVASHNVAVVSPDCRCSSNPCASHGSDGMTMMVNFRTLASQSFVFHNHFILMLHHSAH